MARSYLSTEMKTEIMLQYAEQHLRHTWTIEDASKAFYQYVRLIGPDPGHEREGECACMHCVGMELFGDIHED